LTWDLTALLNAADPQAELAERNLWLVRLLEWLRHAPREEARHAAAAGAPQAPAQRAGAPPRARLGLRQRHRRVWNDVDAVALFAEVGFAPRMALWRVPRPPAPPPAARHDRHPRPALFELLFGTADEDWIAAIDDELLGG
jgi:site-specific recombinase